MIQVPVYTFIMHSIMVAYLILCYYAIKLRYFLPNLNENKEKLVTRSYLEVNFFLNLRTIWKLIMIIMRSSLFTWFSLFLRKKPVMRSLLVVEVYHIIMVSVNFGSSGILPVLAMLDY